MEGYTEKWGHFFYCKMGYIRLLFPHEEGRSRPMNACKDFPARAVYEMNMPGCLRSTLSIYIKKIFISLVRRGMLMSFILQLLFNFIFYFLTPKAFCIGVYPVNNIVIISGEQWRESAIHICVSILPQNSLPSRLAHNINQSSMCCTIGFHWLSILNIAMCTWSSQSP